jgi:ectoine hydroxylase-related dioxygenase (phytanoyl-CoA dioxygenase family)
MLNKAFSQLTETERFKKFDAIIRKNTDNLLSAENIEALLNGIRLHHQYIIIVHPVKRESCGALITDNVLHIYIPEKHAND